MSVTERLDWGNCRRTYSIDSIAYQISLHAELETEPPSL